MSAEWAAGVHPIAVSPRSRRLRWGVAGAVVLAVAIVTTAGAFVLSGAAGAKSLTASVAPQNAIAFLEMRTDLPGDQHAKLADFMSHFPGFKDRAQFDTALDELLNRLTNAISPDLTYTSAFKPWVEGEVSIAVTDLGPVLTGSARGGDSSAQPTPNATEPPAIEPSYSPPNTVVIFALKDRAAAGDWVTSELSRNGLTPTAQDYAGTKLYTVGSVGAIGAYAFTDQDLLLGTVDGVKAALDTKTKGSLADNTNYQAAMKSLSGDSLGRFYVDARAIASVATDRYNLMAQALSGSDTAAAPTLDLSTQDVPAWIAGSVRAESDRVVVDVAYPRVNDAGVGNHVSRLASVLPGDTVGVVEVHSVGKLITDHLAGLEAQIPAGSSIPSAKDVLAAIGGADWLGDGAAVVTKEGSTYGGGLVVEAADASTASTKVALLTNLATLASASYQVTSRDETYKGVDITVIDIPAKAVGLPGEIAGIPVDAAGGPLEIAVAARDNLVVAGYTDAFVKAVIDTTASTSLASQPDYSAVMAAAGLSNQESFYINIPALEDQIGQAVLATSPERWALDYKPYFDHVGGVACSVVDGNTVILRLVVMAK